MGCAASAAQGATSDGLPAPGARGPKASEHELPTLMPPAAVARPAEGAKAAAAAAPRSLVQQPQQAASQRLPTAGGGHHVRKAAREVPFDIQVELARPALLTEVEVGAGALACPGRLEVYVDGVLVAVGGFQEAARPGPVPGRREQAPRCRLELDDPVDGIGAFTLRVTSCSAQALEGEGSGFVEVSEVVPRGLPAGSGRPARRLLQPPPYWGCSAGEPLFRREDLRDEAQVAVFQRLLDETWKAKPTRDRRGAMPSRLLVRKVQRVEAPTLWNRFARRRRQMARRPGGCAAVEDGGAPVRTQGICEAAPELLGRCERACNEHYLFHGTGPAGALGIIQAGFDMSRVGTSTGLMLGPGAYFAEASSKCDEYAKADDFSGMCAVLVCRVLCGRMLRTLGKPDPQVLAEPGFVAKHDGILGDREASVGTYREFVVFTPEQVYPEYLVLYDRVF